MTYTLLSECGPDTTVFDHFFFRTRIMLPTRTVDLDETPGYPGTPEVVAIRAIRLRRGQSVFFDVFAAFPFEVTPPPVVRISFRATEWNISGASWIRNPNMNDRETIIEHRYVNGSWTALGPQQVVLGSSVCRLSMQYSASNPVP